MVDLKLLELQLSKNKPHPEPSNPFGKDFIPPYLKLRIELASMSDEEKPEESDQ